MSLKLRPDPPEFAPIENRLLDRAEAAAFLGIGKRTVARRIADREIVYIKIGSRLLFDPADLRAYAESCKLGGPSK